MFPLRARSLVLSFTAGDDLLSVTPGLESNEALSGSFVDQSLDEFTNILQVALMGQVEVLLELTIRHHHAKTTIFVVGEGGDFGLDDDGSGDHITGMEGLIVLLVCEDVLGGDHGLGGSVLTGLGGGEEGDLAGERLLHDDERAGLHAARISKLGVERT